VDVTFTATDTLSGISGLATEVVVLGEGADQTANSGTFTDVAGNTATGSLAGIDIDLTNPVITAARDLTANGAGWNKTLVKVTFTCTDVGGSGIDTCTLPETLGEGNAQSSDGTAVDVAGNTASVTESGINIDLTDPVVSASQLPLANGAGWNNTAVDVTFTATDTLSGISGLATEVVVLGEGADQTANSGTFTDVAGNTATGSLAGIDIDLTNPSVSASQFPLANGAGWNNTDVTVTASGTDVGGSGIASCTEETLSPDGAGQSATVSCTDNAGNSADATASGIDIDQTAPVVSAPEDQVVIATSAAGAEVSFSVSADASVSGLGDLNSNPGSGSTFPVGTTTVTHTAIDLAGNDSSATHTVTVLGARGLKNRAIGDLAPFEDESKKIEKAIKEIHKSLEKGFVDETHLDSKDGKKVFDHEKHAVKELLHVLKEATKGKGKNKVSEDAAAAVSRAIDDLVTADRILATVQIEAAQDATVGDSKNQDKVDKETEKALKELAKGDAELAKGKEDKAIDDYKKDWEHATHALKEAAKAPKGKK
jgi:hypothetical protein